MKRKARVFAIMLFTPLAIWAQTIVTPLENVESDAVATVSENAIPIATAIPEDRVTEPEAAEAQVVSHSVPTDKVDEDRTVLPALTTGETEEFTPMPLALSSSGTSTGNLITIALDDVELIDVVRMFSRIANANIIATPSNLTARVTANLDAVEWRPALSSILSMYNMALLERPPGSGVYSITSQPADAPEPMQVETIFLDYTTVDEVLPVIEKMLKPGGSISTFASRNAMVIRSTESNLGEIRIMVKNIDIQSQQVCIETLFLELNDSAIKQIGIRWDSLDSLGVGFKAGPFSTEQTKSRETSRADGLKRGDSRIDSEHYIPSFDKDGNRIDPGPMEKNDATTRQFNRSVDLTQEATSDIKDTFTRTIAESSAAILNEVSLNVILSALKKTEGVSIVSNPKVIVANGTTNAFFSVGQRDPIVKITTKRGTPESPGDEVIANLDDSIKTDYIRDGYLNTGIELKVVPTVKADHLIEAQIEPSLRRKIGEKEVEGNSWPVISVKEIKTRFTLQSGQTVAIGGLTDTTDSKKTSKIPLLGDIPIIGKYLFSHTRDEKTQLETIIFVSLTLVEPQKLIPDQGIPERAELVYKERIRAEIRKREVDREVQDLKKASRQAEERLRTQNKGTAAE